MSVKKPVIKDTLTPYKKNKKTLKEDNLPTKDKRIKWLRFSMVLWKLSETCK